MMDGLITLRCPDCGIELQVERDDTDYPEAAVLEVRCDKCDDGDFAESVYLDADGKHIIRDPAATTPDAGAREGES